MSKKGTKSKSLGKNYSADKKSERKISWVWYVLGILVILAVLLIVFKGITGNVVITGNAVDTKEAFKPIVDMVSGLIQTIYEAAKHAVQLIVGETGGDAGIFFAKFLFLLVLLAMISGILGKFPNDFLKTGWTHWIVSIVVSILGVYFLTPDMVRTMLIPNSTLGAVLISALPFIIYFYFVEKSLGAPNPPILRRIAWIAYGVVFLIIWIMTQKEISTPIITTLYPLVIILSVLMAVFDGTLQGILNGWKQEKSKASANADLISSLTRLQNELINHYDGAMKAGTLPAGYPGGSLTGKINASYNPSAVAENGDTAYRKDLEALRKAIAYIK